MIGGTTDMGVSNELHTLGCGADSTWTKSAITLTTARYHAYITKAYFKGFEPLSLLHKHGFRLLTPNRAASGLDTPKH